MKKFAIWVLSLLLTMPGMPISNAASVTASGDVSGDCTQTVSSATDVSVNRIGSDCIVTFAPAATTTWTWTRPASITSFRFLIVGGGGGGGSRFGGGGGAGGFIDTTSVLTNATFQIKVGGGGAGALAPGSTSAGYGETSSVTADVTYSAIGGGSGTQFPSVVNGGNGGSGGGASGTPSGQVGLGKPGQGFNGGTSIYSGTTDSMAQGGGGGAGGLGGNGTASPTVFGGNGGVGKTSNITGSTVYYAGGGGGGTYTGTYGVGGTCGTSATGGNGGGGNAGACLQSQAAANAGGNGTQNTGGGGGGASTYNTNTVAVGGNGGSGVVIIRYTLMLYPILGSPTLSGNPTKGLPVTLSATSDTAGRITFYIFGKKIGGCISRLTTGSPGNYSASCSWKPSIQGAFQVTAVIKPTDPNYSSTSSGKLMVSVGKRTTNR
jgi:hypothetical protein